MGIDIGGTKIFLCAVNESGQVLASYRIPTRSSDGAHVVLDRLTAAAQALIERVLVEHLAEVGAVGVVTPGVVEVDSVKLAPNNQGWEQVALATTIGGRLGLDAVEADNDAKAATAAEARWGALAGVSDGILLNLGTGISAGAIVGGQLLRGAHGAALEIAYQVPSSGPLRGFLQGHAPLEETLSGADLEAAASALLGRPTGTDEVFAAMTLARVSGPNDRPDGDSTWLAALGQTSHGTWQHERSRTWPSPSIRRSLRSPAACLARRRRSLPGLAPRWPSWCRSRPGWSLRTSHSRRRSPGHACWPTGQPGSPYPSTCSSIAPVRPSRGKRPRSGWTPQTMSQVARVRTKQIRQGPKR